MAECVPERLAMRHLAIYGMLIVLASPLGV
jgi:hypothetical protein